jgi:hypothetical protein
MEEAGLKRPEVLKWVKTARLLMPVLLENVNETKVSFL